MIYTLRKVFAKRCFELGVRSGTVVDKKKTEVSFFRFLADFLLFLFRKFGVGLVVQILCSMIQCSCLKHRNADCFGHITTSVKFLIVLVVGEIPLLEPKQNTLLLEKGLIRVLVVRLRQDDLFDKFHKLQWIRSCHGRCIIRIVLHLVLENLGALAKDKVECLASMLSKLLDSFIVQFNCTIVDGFVNAV